MTNPQVSVQHNVELAPLLTAEQVAEYLVVPVATLYAWSHRGQGPKPIKVGRHLRYRLSVVEAWLNEQSS